VYSLSSLALGRSHIGWAADYRPTHYPSCAYCRARVRTHGGHSAIRPRRTFKSFVGLPTLKPRDVAAEHYLIDAGRQRFMREASYSSEGFRNFLSSSEHQETYLLVVATLPEVT
jgi:hypothetical protein